MCFTPKDCTHIPRVWALTEAGAPHLHYAFGSWQGKRSRHDAIESTQFGWVRSQPACLDIWHLRPYWSRFCCYSKGSGWCVRIAV
jgi:hypothetical protein